MNPFKKSLSFLAKGSVFGAIFSLGALLAVGASWSGPTASPTAANASAPISVTGDQTKAGALILNAVKSDNSYAATGLDVINGNVGIGVAVPGAKLQVANGDSSYALFGPNASWSGYLVVGSGGSSIAAGKAEVLSTNGNLHLDAGTGQSIYIAYFTGDNTFINPNGGSVGIGTVSPSQKLDVNGNVNVSGNYVFVGGGPSGPYFYGDTVNAAIRTNGGVYIQSLSGGPGNLCLSGDCRSVWPSGGSGPAGPAGPTGATGPQGPQGPAGAAGLSTVVVTGTANGPFAVATCPAGRTAISGGCSFADHTRILTTTMRGDLGGGYGSNQWICQWTAGSSAYVATALALCQ